MLINRGHQLINTTNHLLREYRNQSLGHLVANVEYELSIVESLIFELTKVQHIKSPESNDQNFTIEQIHLIQEQLFHQENRILEELDILNQAASHQHQSLTAKQLLVRARELVSVGREVLRDFAAPENHLEIASIEHEIHLIEQLILILEKKNANEVLRHEEQQLILYQKSMLHMVERIQAHMKGPQSTSSTI